ncbi:MAG: hypothetical protein KIT25_21265 [Enhydrobacter sp.]|nr:MAG: hypothetical protein KIT25_21265 [Enhydrobacter sp.]
MRRAGTLALLAAWSAPVAAQADDAAYCAQLADLARRYIGQQGMGKNSPDLDTAIAIDRCEKGDTASGIPVLERKLRQGGFSLPKR